MQLTGPVFLFLLLPLSLLICRITPPRRRRSVLSLLSVAWYALVNASNPIGLLHIAFLLIWMLLYVYLPQPNNAAIGKLRTILGVTVPTASFLLARLLSEYGSSFYTYPIGLAFITLSAVSLTVDMARGDTVRPQSPLDVVGYLLFVPTLVAGPIIRSKHYFDNTEELHMTSEHFSIGARLYMIGFIKRIAMAAVLLRALRQLLDYVELMISPLLLLFLLAGSYFAFYFFFTGTADMARGICYMYGIKLPRDRGHILSTSAPDRILCGIALSLYRFMLDYVYHPLKRILPAKIGPFAARMTVFVLSALFLRTRPEMLIFALPMLLLLLISLRRRAKRPRLYLRLLFIPLTVFACSFFTLAMMTERPMKIFSLIGKSFTGSSNFHFYQIFDAVRDFRYLLVVIFIFFAIVLLSYFGGWFWKHANSRLRVAVKYLSLLLIFGTFTLSIVYLMPQFPSYADQAYGFYQYTR